MPISKKSIYSIIKQKDKKKQVQPVRAAPVFLMDKFGFIYGLVIVFIGGFAVKLRVDLMAGDQIGLFAVPLNARCFRMNTEAEVFVEDDLCIEVCIPN